MQQFVSFNCNEFVRIFIIRIFVNSWSGVNEDFSRSMSQLKT